jgi:hypothetical protein
MPDSSPTGAAEVLLLLAGSSLSSLEFLELVDLADLVDLSLFFRLKLAFREESMPECDDGETGEMLSKF